MLENYLKIAWRKMMRNKVFSFINVFGLTVGLTCCLLITIYIYHEVSYDRHHANHQKIFRLGTIFIDQGEENIGSNSSAPLGRMLQEEFPEIVSSTRVMKLFRDDKTLFQVNDEQGGTVSVYENRGLLADSNFFQTLTYPFIEGNPATALAAPNSAVIHESTARKLFGNQPALNRVVRISSSTQGDTSYRITGVFSTPEGPTHLDAGFFLSFRGGRMNSLANGNTSLFNNNMFHTYLVLRDATDAARLQEKFPGFIRRHLAAQLMQTGKQRRYFLTAMKDIHLSGIGNNSFSPGGNRTTLFILASIAVLTLLIACINFMNLSTANSAKRAAEVGVRKVMGAQKNTLLRQFLGESLLMSTLALILAVLATILLLPLFESISGKELRISSAQVMTLGAFLVFLTVITGLVAGSYPAFYLSSFRPVSVLKGKFSNSLAAVSLRRALVVFQFVISIGLIIASIVIVKQMRFLQAKDLGFQKDQQVIIPLRTSTAKNNVQAIKDRLEGSRHIASVGTSMSYPGIFNPQDWLMYAQGQTMDNSKQVFINLIDNSFLQTLGVRLVAGRLFSASFAADTLTGFVINEEAVKTFGFASPEDAVGKWLAFDSEGTQNRFNIVGVVKDFHFKSLQDVIEPFAFRFYNDADIGFNYMIARSSGGHIGRTLSELEAAWKTFNPEEPFEYSFLDQDFQKNYEAENRRATLIHSFTIIAIIISCLGLFGLASFMAEQRTKEIGIRKVLGASVSGLVVLLSTDFLKLVVMAVLFASPLAWYVMNKWLQNFAYKTVIGWEVFVLTGTLAVAIAFATISFQAIRAAIINPVNSLRSE